MKENWETEAVGHLVKVLLLLEVPDVSSDLFHHLPFGPYWKTTMWL